MSGFMCNRERQPTQRQRQWNASRAWCQDDQRDVPCHIMPHLDAAPSIPEGWDVNSRG